MILSEVVLADNILRIGIIGCDTSHVPAFTEIFNRTNQQVDLAGMRVTAAYPGGSDDIPDSKDRVAGYTQQLQDKGVQICGSIDAPTGSGRRCTH